MPQVRHREALAKQETCHSDNIGEMYYGGAADCKSAVLGHSRFDSCLSDYFYHGEVPEWFKGPVCKTGIRRFKSDPPLTEIARSNVSPGYHHNMSISLLFTFERIVARSLASLPRSRC